MRRLILLLIALLGVMKLAHAQVAADPVYWANLDRVKSTKKFGLSTLDMRANYFGEFLGSNVGKFDGHQYDQTGARTRDPITMLHTLSVHTQLTDDMRLTLAPRFITPMGDKSELRETDDQKSLQMDDWTVAVTQVWLRDEHWTLDTRLQERLPTSMKSKNDHVDGQTEVRQGVSYRARPELSFTTQSTVRYYHYDGEATEERYRLNQTTFINYIHTDKWNMQIMHEYEQQHRNPKTGKGNRAWNHTIKNKDQLALGVGYNFTRSLNVMPFVKALDDANIRPETIQAGLWVSANVF